MNKKIISPNPNQPIDRVPSGQLPSVLAELCEESLGTQIYSSRACWGVTCSYDGDEE